jgi:hypothetical protein
MWIAARDRLRDTSSAQQTSAAREPPQRGACQSGLAHASSSKKPAWLVRGPRVRWRGALGALLPMQ